MRLKKVVLQLTPEEIPRFVRIITDKDKDEALTFLNDIIKPQVDDATRDH